MKSGATLASRTAVRRPSRIVLALPAAPPAGHTAARSAVVKTAAPAAHATADPSPALAALAVAGHTHGGGGGAPAPIIALAVLGALLALATGIYGLARWRGWDPPWV